jgi:hypothetical protein
MRVSRGEFRCASKVVAQSQCGFALVNGNFVYHVMNVKWRNAAFAPTRQPTFAQATAR